MKSLTEVKWMNKLFKDTPEIVLNTSSACDCALQQCCGIVWEDIQFAKLI